MMNIKLIKIQLHKKCQEFIQDRINNFQEALQNSKDSANSEVKSSAGDKHETGRAMMQIEQEKNVKQLQEALELKNVLEKINPEMESNSVSSGSLVITDKGNFYIAISAGKAIIEGETYFLISNLSPISNCFKGAKAGEKRIFNGQSYLIQKIF